MYLGEPRFRVSEIEGYGESQGGGSKYGLITSFAVIDRAYCCAIVWQNYGAKGGRGPLWSRRIQANAKCDELNAKHA